MRATLVRLVFVWTTVAALELFGGGIAEACVCVVATCGNLTSAASVIEATVESIESVSEPVAMPGDASATFDSTRVRLREVRVWRGSEAPTVLVTGGACGYEDFRPGVRYLIETSRGPGGHSVSMCSLVREIQLAQPLLDYLQALNAGSKDTRVIGSVARITGFRGYEGADTPVKDAQVILRGAKQVTLTTNANGFFSAIGLPEGMYDVTVRVNGKVLPPKLEWSPFLLGRDGKLCEELSIEVPANGSVEVAVFREDGTLMKGAFVYLSSADHIDQDGERPGFGATLPEGKAVVTQIPPGRYVIEMNPAGPKPGSPYLETVSPVFVIEEGKLATPPPLRPRRASKIAVAGVVRDGTGAPLAGVQVEQWIQLMNGRRSTDWPRPKTDAEGRFEVQLWKDQLYVLTVGPDYDDPWGRIEFIADGHPVAITARPR